MSYIDISYPIKTSAHPNAGQTIKATAGLPGFQMGCTPEGPISAYGNLHTKLTTGGGGTAHANTQAGNTGDDHVGDGNA